MPRKKKIKKSDILERYIDYYLEYGEQPASVYQFAKINDFDEKDFYAYFGSFDGLEKQIFSTFCDQAVALLNKSEDFKSFDPRNQLLSFYYTFFEILTANRSFILAWWGKNENPMKSVSKLSDLRQSFLEFFRTLDIEKIDVKEERIQKFTDKSMEESAWAQLLATMKFWKQDASPSFEKTDMLIEKSINTGFDLLDVKPLKSVLDLGKFLFKEKFHMS